MAGLTLEVWHLRSASALLLAAAVRSFVASESSSILLALLAFLLWFLSTHASRQDADEQAQPTARVSETSQAAPVVTPPTSKKDDAAELFKQWTGNVMMADAGVAMPAAQIARAWLQMARSKGHGAIPSKSSFSSLVKTKQRVGSSSDLCGSITEGDESAGSPWEGPIEDAFYVELERESSAEDWGLVWQQPALSSRRRLFLESVSENSPAAHWNGRERELGRTTLEPGSILVEVNGLAGFGVIRHELGEAVRLRLAFLRPAQDVAPAEKKLNGLRLECRVKNSFLEVSPIDADSQDEARHFSDPGPAPQKGFSSSAEGVSAAEPQICGYHTESEAVSDLIGTSALIAGLVRSAEFNGKWCKIDAFDPEVRRYIVRVFLEDGQPPVIAKLRLENLVLEPTPAMAPTMLQAAFQTYAEPLPGPCAMPSGAPAEAEMAWPWAGWPWMLGMAGATPTGMEADAWQVPAEWAAYPFGPPGLPSTQAAMMQCMPAQPDPQTPLCILPNASLQFGTNDDGSHSHAGPPPDSGGDSNPRPPQIHTHQVLEQQLIQQQMQTLQQSGAPDVQEAAQPSVSSSRQTPEPAAENLEPEVAADVQEEDGEQTEAKKKRRRRRRGKRKGHGTKDGDEDHEDSDVPEDPSLIKQEDTVPSGRKEAAVQALTEAEPQVQDNGMQPVTSATVPDISPLEFFEGRTPEECSSEVGSWKPRLDGAAGPVEAAATDDHSGGRSEAAGQRDDGGETARLHTESQSRRIPPAETASGPEMFRSEPSSGVKHAGATGFAASWRPSLARSTDRSELVDSEPPASQEPICRTKSDTLVTVESSEPSETASWQPSLQRRTLLR